MAQEKEESMKNPEGEIAAPDHETSRTAARITLARIKSYNELWAPTEQSGDKRFLEKTKELWKDLVVSGIVGAGKDKKIVVHNFTDLDGKSSIGLLGLAGIDTSHVRYVASGEYEQGAINMDTGNKQGLVVEDEGETAFMDHHAKESKNDTSSAAIVYKTLVSLGLLQRTPAMDKLVEFVTHVDNRTYPEEEKQFAASWHTVLGLSRFITFPKLLEYFKSGRGPTEKLSPEDLERLGLAYGSRKQESVVTQSVERLKAMHAEGLIVPSKYGNTVVDIGKTVDGGFEAIKALHCGCYIIWSPEQESFFVSTTTPLREEFPQGKKIRETMWIKPRHDTEPLRVKLAEILRILGVNEAAVTGKLKEFLRDEEQGVKKQ